MNFFKINPLKYVRYQLSGKDIDLQRIGEGFREQEE